CDTWQTPLAQSPFTLQIWLRVHLAAHEPPQSTSVSSPSSAPSPQDDVQIFIVWWQCLLAQSLSLRHFLLRSQAAQTPPPQSLSVPSPPCWASPHWFGTQTICTAWKMAVLQSPSTLHFLLRSQAPKTAPPQSTSVSPGSSLEFRHWLDTHLPLELQLP